MNSLLEHAIMGMDLKEIDKDLPAGKVIAKEEWLESIPIPPKRDAYIKGKFDFVSKLDDGTYSVIDFKITNPAEDKILKFTNQVHAYKFALENPSQGIPKKVSKMGIIAINPTEISFPGESVIFKAKPFWFEIKENMDGFYKFIGEVSALLSGPEPEENPNCQWCRYRICTHKPQNAQEEMPF
jgi:CRISPR/Cas system-associated exonuclease Cas4 (RecB family)